MTPPRRVPAEVARALRPTAPHCYRHCDRPVPPHRLRTRLPGDLTVYACPGGAVSVTVYAEWSERDPTAAVALELRRRCRPPTIVRARDLRTATRHGPELGPAAERRLARSRPVRPIRGVYWRLYPFRRDGEVHRLFACFRHGAGSVTFFVAPVAVGRSACPACATRRRRRV